MIGYANRHEIYWRDTNTAESSYHVSLSSCFKNLESAWNIMRVHGCMNDLSYEKEKGEKQLYLKPEVFTLKIVMIIVYHCIFY